MYGAETWAFRKVHQKYLESFEMWCWRTEKIGWTDRVRVMRSVIQSEGQEYPTYSKEKED